MKQAHNIAQVTRSSPYRTCKWIGGFFVLIIGSFLYIAALCFGNQIFLGCSSAISIIFNTVISAVVLKERIVKTDILAIILICIGTITFMVIAKNEKIALTTDQIQNLYLNVQSIIFISSCLVLLIIIYLFNHAIRNMIDEFYMVHVCFDLQCDSIENVLELESSSERS
jgi:hypothetical protein